MRVWIFLLGGILVWTADFFLLYAIASIFLTTPTARILALAVSLCALAADAWLLRRSSALSRSAGDPYGRWIASLSFLTAVISMIGVLWLAFPAVLA
jgi:hypothetical protein